MDIFRQGIQEVHNLLHTTTNIPRIQPGGHQDAPMATRQRPLCHEKARGTKGTKGSMMTMSSVQTFRRSPGQQWEEKNKMAK